MADIGSVMKVIDGGKRISGIRRAQCHVVALRSHTERASRLQRCCKNRGACGLVQFQVQIMRVNGVKLRYAFGEHAVDGRQYPPTHHDIHSPFLFLLLCDSTGLQPFAVDRPAFFSHLGDAQISSSAATEKKEAEYTHRSSLDSFVPIKRIFRLRHRQNCYYHPLKDDQLHCL